MTEVEKILRLVQLFDEWLATASEESIRQNCREQGTVFFAFVRARGVYPGWAANVIRRATGYNAAQLWQAANLPTVKEALNSYYLSMQAVSLEEAENGGQQLSVYDTQDIVLRFWE